MSDQLPARVNLAAYHGDTWAQTFRLKHDTTPVDLTGASVAAWALPSKGTVVPLAAAVTNPTSGELQISIGPAGLPSGTFTYDVEVTAGTVVTTWIRGSLTVTSDITHREDLAP